MMRKHSTVPGSRSIVDRPAPVVYTPGHVRDTVSIMATLRLSLSYPARPGRPVVSCVDTDIFTLRYFTDCMACDFCGARCCQYGVDVDAELHGRIMDHAGELEALAGMPRTDWFTDSWTEDPEVPGGRYTRTRVVGGGCVFRTRSAGCLLHSYCLRAGIDYHDLKPMVSTLFPVTFEGGTLLPSAEAADGELVCGGQGKTLYEGLRGELCWYFGNGLVAELDALRPVEPGSLP